MAKKAGAKKAEKKTSGEKRNRRSTLQLMLDKLIKGKAVLGKLAEWEASPGSDLDNAISQVEAMIENGFTSPTATRAATKGFEQGDTVQLKEKFYQKYAEHLEAEELESMVYDGFDPAAKMVQITTTNAEGGEGRRMIVKPRQIEARTVESAQ